MGWNKKYKLVATVGEYTDREGNKKKQYTTIGHEFENEKGNRALKIDQIPVGWNGWFMRFNLDEERQTQVQQDRQTVGGYHGNYPQQTLTNSDDYLPF